MHPGHSLRQAREKLGLTYREVERASYELASQHGRPEFVLHISRLADIENSGVTPGIHKLYSLCAIYHLDLFEVCGWYNVPLDQLFSDGNHLPARKTHRAAPPRSMRVPVRFDPGFDPRRTAYLTRMVEDRTHLEGVMLHGGTNGQFRYGYIGLDDRWMQPILRPGSLVLLDPSRQQIQNSGWRNEHERPIYFVDIRDAYRCCWCQQNKGRIVFQPHPLSPCLTESRRFPDEADIVGQVVGIAMRLFPE